jgi:hypothetical protein
VPKNAYRPFLLKHSCIAAIFTFFSMKISKQRNLYKGGSCDIVGGNFNHVSGALIKCARSHSHVSYHTFIITATILFPAVARRRRRRRGIKHINDSWRTGGVCLLSLLSRVSIFHHAKFNFFLSRNTNVTAIQSILHQLHVNGPNLTSIWPTREI